MGLGPAARATQGGGVRTLVSVGRVVVGLGIMALRAVFIGAALLLLLPSRMARIRVCQLTGKNIAPFYVWLLGCRTTIHGARHLDSSRPAICVSNHTSPADIFIAGTYTPYWAVSVAKKQILYYPSRSRDKGRLSGLFSLWHETRLRQRRRGPA